ncbi:hypothetical protein ACOBQX_17700 [Actinokineospora sp. G85]|uniref:hypothetical protein n=1 Tax=Actinokineospora sp. G85 TaxID=3406626 RepID=UPI003C7119D9
MRNFPLLSPVLATVLLLGACSSGGPDNGPGPAPVPEPAIPASPAPAPASAAEVRLPLDPYVRLAAGNEDVIGKASAILVAKCMREKGFDYTPDPAGPTAPPAPLPPYGINDLAQAKQSGYSPPGSGNLQSMAEQGSSLPSIDEAVREHGEAWVKALYGFSPPKLESDGTGCYDTSFVRVPEYDRLDRELPGKLQGQSVELTQADGRVVAASGEWSACMAESGFHYRTPAEPRQQKWPTPTSPAETATAVADVTCKDKTNLPGVWLAVQAGYQQTLLDRNAPALNELRAAWQLVVKEAERITATGG